MKINSCDIVYSEHGYDECFEYKDGRGRVPEGTAVGYIHTSPFMKQETFFLFDDMPVPEGQPIAVEVDLGDSVELLLLEGLYHLINEEG